ncbi:MAG: hypothetical protein FWF92_03725 [Oscillospiraceae bacterium]|nr:hypothetical protein [Oscillospiraceae bacterium]
MKKILAILLAVFLLAMPVLAGWEEDANIGNVKYTIGKAPSAPVLGQFDTSKYTKIEPAAGDMSYAWNDSLDDGLAWAQGHSFDAYVSYDASNLYVLLRTDSKYYFNESEDGDGNAWQFSGIQVSVAGQNDEGGDRLEYGIWRKSDDGGLGGVVWAQHPDAKAEFEPVGGSNYTVALVGSDLWYETIIPVNTFLNADSVAEGGVIAWNLVMVQCNPADEGYIHTQIASGCTGNGKTAENLARLTLGAEIAPPVVEAPPEEVPEVAAPEEAAPAPAPAAPAPAAPTGDAGIITLAVVMMIAAAGVVVLRRKAVK